MKKFLLFIMLYAFNLYAVPLSFSPAPSISASLSDDFQDNILPQLHPVSDIYYQKAYKKYQQIYIDDEFTLYDNLYNKLHDNNTSGTKSIIFSKDYLYPSSVLSMQIFLVDKQEQYSFVEIFFIESTGKISQVYSVSGYILNNIYKIQSSAFHPAPQWLYGTLAVIYHDECEYSSYDILQDNDSIRPASLIFIPEDRQYFSSVSNTAVYPALNVINKQNSITFLVKDRRILSYFNKYEAEPQGSFQKYLGGAVTMKAYIYAYTFSTTQLDNKNKLEIQSIPALFQLEKDKGFNRSFAYQKSYYKSLAPKDKDTGLTVLDTPNGNVVTKIDASYYRSRDILYTPWNNRYAGEELWYAVIIPKLNKTGYILSSTADIVEKGYK